MRLKCLLFDFLSHKKFIELKNTQAIFEFFIENVIKGKTDLLYNLPQNAYKSAWFLCFYIFV